MTYFKIDGVDFSMYVNELTIDTEVNYNAQTNAAGNTVVDYINRKRSFKVGIIPLKSDTMKTILAAIDKFSVSISFLNPRTNELEENVNCIIPKSSVEYYTIQANKTMYEALSLTFTEL